MSARQFHFVGGSSGTWRITSMRTVVGEPLVAAPFLAITPGAVPAVDGTRWILSGVTSNDRYTTRGEKDRLRATQAAIGRPHANHGALIPIRKTGAWWGLTQDERRAIFEERSRHTQVGLRYLPAIARRLHHCRDLGDNQPFDFVTLFDFADADAGAFEDLVAALRETEEWQYIDREVDIRMVREP